MKKSNIIKLNFRDKSKFAQELDILNSVADFYFDDVLINNIDEFFKFVVENKIDKINLYKFDKIDIILVRKAMKFFNNFHKQVLESCIKFIDFTQEEICEIISKELYFLYCNKYNIKFIKNNKSIKDESNKLKEHGNNLFIYSEFDIIYKFYKNNDRYMYFNFPKENKLNRFVFYFLINTENDKCEIIELLKNINFNSKCLDIFSKIEVCENGSLYAIGFNYEKSSNKLIRSTLYSRLNEFSSKIQREEFIKKEFDLNLKNFVDKDLVVKDWGFDVCEENSEILKLYFKGSRFNQSNKNELSDVLDQKPCVACFKFSENKLIGEKFEFSNDLFNNNEVKILEKFNIYNKKSKLFSIYFDDNGNIKNSVNYMI
jgi:hypothetical protein